MEDGVLDAVDLLDASTRSVYLMLAHPPEDQIQPVKDQRTGCDDLSHVGQGCPRRFDNQDCSSRAFCVTRRFEAKLR